MLDSKNKRDYYDVDFKNIADYVKLLCRDKKCFIHRDSLEIVPYLNALVNSNCSNNPMTDDGRYIVDESFHVITALIDLYRAWLEGDKFSNLSSRGRLASVARRMGFDNDLLRR